MEDSHPGTCTEHSEPINKRVRWTVITTLVSCVVGTTCAMLRLAGGDHAEIALTYGWTSFAATETLLLAMIEFVMLGRALVASKPPDHDGTP